MNQRLAVKKLSVKEDSLNAAPTVTAPPMLGNDDPAEFETPATKAARTARWAVTMTKVRIRQAVAGKAFPRWHFVTFGGRAGAEATGIVDLLAIRKDHSLPTKGLKRGDKLRIILIQIKGGSAADPTPHDAERLRAVKRLHGAEAILLASWKKGAAATFYTLRERMTSGHGEWNEVEDLKSIFC